MTGRRPKRSESSPSTGEKKNCMEAHVVANSPRYSDARAVLPPTKSEISLGRIGTTTPNDNMSSRTVTKMKPRAACRLPGMRNLLQLRRNRIQGVEPQIYSSIHSFAVAGSTVVEHEAAKSGNDDGGEGARFA